MSLILKKYQNVLVSHCNDYIMYHVISSISHSDIGNAHRKPIYVSRRTNLQYDQVRILIIRYLFINITRQFVWWYNTYYFIIFVVNYIKEKKKDNFICSVRWQHLVDWSSAMIPQIYKLGSTYAKWVNMPVDRPLRLFEPDWIENLTKTPWWVVPTFWIPTICYICRSGVLAAGQSSAVSYT